MEWSLPGLGTAMHEVSSSPEQFYWRETWASSLPLGPCASEIEEEYCHNLLQCLTSFFSEPHEVLLPEMGHVVQVVVQTVSCCKTVATHFWLGVHVLCPLETWQPWLGDWQQRLERQTVWTELRKVISVRYPILTGFVSVISILSSCAVFNLLSDHRIYTVVFISDPFAVALTLALTLWPLTLLTSLPFAGSTIINWKSMVLIPIFIRVNEKFRRIQWPVLRFRMSLQRNYSIIHSIISP